MLTLTKEEIENSVYRNLDLKRTALELYDKLEKAETKRKAAYECGLSDGAAKQAILEIQGRDKFLEGLKSDATILSGENVVLRGRIEKAAVEFAEFKADIALLLDQKEDYIEKLFEENEALKAEIEGLKKIIAAVNSTASGGYINGYIK